MKPGLRKLVGMRGWSAEWPLPFALTILIVGWVFKPQIAADAIPDAVLVVAFVAFFVGALAAAFSAVRHAEHLAHRFGEPYGTLILTLAAISIEVATIVTIMLHGANNPFIARDTMFAVLMIILNGVVGVGLLIGGLKHREQSYNLQGANAFLSVLIPLAVLALILPDLTVGGGVGVHPTEEAIFLIVMSLLLYGVFLAMQTRRHRSYFIAPETIVESAHEQAAGRGWQYHAGLMIVYLLMVVFTAKLFALPLDIGLDGLGLPPGVGALAVAILVLAPESMAAIKAARLNQMQRAVNISLGTALSTISLTVPAVLAIDLFTHHTVFLGLTPAYSLMLVLTLGVSILTFSSKRTNMLQGMVHILLFLTYILLIFAP
ncbi:MAG: calcium:proton antiporter [Gammaproteobacteria bacterium]